MRFHMSTCAQSFGHDFELQRRRISAIVWRIGRQVPVQSHGCQLLPDQSQIADVQPARPTARNQPDCDACGVRLVGCGNGEATVADNTITCASASYAGYAGGVELTEGFVIGSNRNTISRNTIQGTGGWAIEVETFDLPSEGNSFIDNILARFFAQEAGAVFFGPQANYNFFSGDVGAGIIDLGIGNVVE